MVGKGDKTQADLSEQILVAQSPCSVLGLSNFTHELDFRVLDWQPQGITSHMRTFGWVMLRIEPGVHVLLPYEGNS